MHITLNESLQAEFGCKVYKLALDAGLGCPNRDGRLGTGGCIFCSQGGSGDFAEPCRTPEQVKSAIQLAKARVSGKIGCKKALYIPYFQSYTNTYAPAEYLEPLFLAAINDPEAAALSVATRPDCLPDDIIEMLSRLSKIKPVYVELGLQTVHPETARFIRRGYDLPVYDNAVKRLKSIGVRVVVHLILGLPYVTGESEGILPGKISVESEEMVLESVRYAVESGISGIKLQLLHILRGTDLEKIYTSGCFKALEREEYIHLLDSCLKIIPPEIVIHRLTGDAPRKLLVAPEWSLDKKSLLNEINMLLRA